ncbi:MAG: hypothetical protein P4M11_01835, partial [Candidatus Pacebacteria bacterium]|nr:hypothetical protein [Candidatus Paceibacterota bacterium]
GDCSGQRLRLSRADTRLLSLALFLRDSNWNSATRITLTRSLTRFALCSSDGMLAALRFDLARRQRALLTPTRWSAPATGGVKEYPAGYHERMAERRREWEEEEAAVRARETPEERRKREEEEAQAAATAAAEAAGEAEEEERQRRTWLSQQEERHLYQAAQWYPERVREDGDRGWIYDLVMKAEAQKRRWEQRQQRYRNEQEEKEEVSAPGPILPLDESESASNEGLATADRKETAVEAVPHESITLIAAATVTDALCARRKSKRSKCSRQWIQTLPTHRRSARIAAAAR